MITQPQQAKLDGLQEKAAKQNAPRQHFLDKDHKPPFIRVSFPLWDKKVNAKPSYQTEIKFVQEI